MISDLQLDLLPKTFVPYNQVYYVYHQHCLRANFSYFPDLGDFYFVSHPPLFIQQNRDGFYVFGFLRRNGYFAHNKFISFFFY